MVQAQPRSFQTTRWSLVLAAGGTTSPRSEVALAELCRLYWYPVYAFVRRTGKSADASLDLTQGFFADLLQRKAVGVADPARGRFRSWLLGCLKHHLANRHDHDTAQKRGGGTPTVPLDGEDAEGRYSREPVEGVTPEKLYLRRWVLLLVDRVLTELREEKVRAGTVERFDRLKPYLVDEGEASHTELGGDLGMDANAVKQAIHRLRERFRDRLRTEVAGTVESVEEIDDEVRLLLAALA